MGRRLRDDARATPPPASIALPFEPGWLPGLALAAMTLVLGLLWALLIGPLEAPDEPSHLLAIQQVRKTWTLPTVHYAFDLGPEGRVVDTPIDEPTQRYAQRAGFADEFRTSPYEGMQPPLYYIAAAILAAPSSLDPAWVLYLARFTSAVFGSLAILGLWRAVRWLAPDSRQLSVAAGGLGLLVPQFGFVSGTASNDAALACISAWAFALWFRGLRQPDYDPHLVRAGAITGVALVTKLSGLALVPGLAVILVARSSLLSPSEPFTARLRRALPMVLGASLGFLATSGWWLARNVWVYGEPTGSRDALRVYKARFDALDATSASAWSEFALRTWETLWGRFGWINLRLPQPVYAAWGLWTLACLLVGLEVWRRGHGLDRAQRAAVLSMAAVTFAILGLYLQFNLTVAFQGQGRYLLPALVPFALALASGPALVAARPQARRLLLAVFGLLLVGLYAGSVLFVATRSALAP